MMVGVHIEAEDILTGAVRHTNTCVLTYVAIDKDLKPVPVPGLILETEEEEQIWRKAEARRVKK
jgi:acyl-CoA hydrolase